ncbi:hypothetical protein DFH29DRAFT_870904 [Suillus ampliporus]|nr:hypothetical protein DFH29DRAFT_870904 [Suillus ampliporus]
MWDDEVQAFQVELMECILLEETSRQQAKRYILLITSTEVYSPHDGIKALRAIESELNNLRSCTGTKAILYMIHRSTDPPLHGIAFATKGMEEFMMSIMNVDNQDLISKMEGFAVQGMKAIHNEINKKLVEITKDDNAKMHWANYFHNVIQCYQVIVEGWPTNIPFINLSKVSSALPDLEIQVNNEEFQQLFEEHNEKLKTGKIIDNHWQTHSDKGKKWVQSPDDSGMKCRKKMYKSAETVNTDDEDDAPTLPANADANGTSANTNSISNSTINVNVNMGTIANANNNTVTDANNNTDSDANTGVFNFLDPSTSLIPQSPMVLLRSYRTSENNNIKQ